MTTPIPEAAVEAAALAYAECWQEGMGADYPEGVFPNEREVHTEAIQDALTAARPLMEAEIRGQIAEESLVVEAASLNLTIAELRLSRAVDLVAPGGLQCSYEDANRSCEEESIASALVADRWLGVCVEHLAIYNNGPTPLWQLAYRAATIAERTHDE